MSRPRRHPGRSGWAVSGRGRRALPARGCRAERVACGHGRRLGATTTGSAVVADELAALGVQRAARASSEVEGSFDLCIASPGIPPSRAAHAVGRERMRPASSPRSSSRSASPARRGSPSPAPTARRTTTALIAHLLDDRRASRAAAVGNIGPPAIAAVRQTDELRACSSPRSRRSSSRSTDDVPPPGRGAAQHHARPRRLARLAGGLRRRQGPRLRSNLDADDIGGRSTSMTRAPRPTPTRSRRAASHVVRVSLATRCTSRGATVVDGVLVLETRWRSGSSCRAPTSCTIRGAHNVSNALAAAAAAHALGVVGDEHPRRASRRFAPIEHRLEPVGEVGGAEWFNDSKATNPDAVLKALTAFAERPLIVLLAAATRTTTSATARRGRRCVAPRPRSCSARRADELVDGVRGARASQRCVPRVSPSGLQSGATSQSRATRSCCRPRAPRSTSSRTTRSAAASFKASVRAAMLPGRRLRERPQARYAGGAAARYLLLGSAVFLTVVRTRHDLLGIVDLGTRASGASAVLHLASSRSSSWWSGLIVALRRCPSSTTGAVRSHRGSRLVGIASRCSCVTYVARRRAGRRAAVDPSRLRATSSRPSSPRSRACCSWPRSQCEWQRGRLDTGKFAGAVIGVDVGVPVGAHHRSSPTSARRCHSCSRSCVVLVPRRGIELRVGRRCRCASSLAHSVAAIIVEPYRLARVLTLPAIRGQDPQGKGYQTIQALLAFGTGGLKGVGLGLSRQKFFYLPEAHTDFIFAIIGEEVGLIGTLAVVVGVRRLALRRDPHRHGRAGPVRPAGRWRAHRRCSRSRRSLNMAAVTGLIPVTGKPLPFVSYGGSSMLVTMICVGLILSVSEYGARVAPRGARQRRERGARACEC